MKQLAVAAIVVLFVSSCTSAEPVAGSQDEAVVAEQLKPLPEEQRTYAASANLSEALRGLEAALRRSDHPLADASARPAGRSADEIQQAANRLLDKEVPAELVELWGWWGSITFPSDHEGAGLPGRVYFESLEAAVELRDELIESELLSRASAQWLPAGWVSQEVSLWFELDACDNGVVPVTVNWVYGPAEESPHWRFCSIAEFVDAMTDLVNNGYWVYSEERRWHYTGEHGEVQWVDPKGPMPSSLLYTTCDGGVVGPPTLQADENQNEGV